MESPVVVDKPPGYHRDDRGFPFDEEEGSGAWSELASRHPDIAARLRQHPATWARKRRPSSQDHDDFGESFTGFDRFPFDDIPPEFREHFPSHWNRSRFVPRDEPQPQTSQSPPQNTAGTQTEPPPAPEPQTSLPQYGLRNTVDLGQKSVPDPSLVDADDRNQRSMSAPPESRTNNTPKMSGQNQEPPPKPHGTVYNIPIMVEGRDEPVINKLNDNVDRASNFGDSKPTYMPQQPPLDNSYFSEEGPVGFHPPRNFARSFGNPLGKNFQPFAEQKMFPQSAANLARGASPQRSQSPKPQAEFTKVPVHHERQQPKPQPQKQPPQPQKQPPQPQKQPPQPPQRQQPQPQTSQPPPQQQQPPKQPTPPPVNDPITQILAIQTDVLNLMTEVENFTGTKKDKRYLFLDEMLTRNLIKLDNIETEGKENIRNARKEAIRCIQKCIAVLEAKAEKGSQEAASSQDVEMKGEEQKTEKAAEKTSENGEVEMKEQSKDVTAEQKPETATTDVKDTPQAADTRPEENKGENVDKQTKNVKKDKSKEKVTEAMQVDDSKGENKMDVDGGASQI